MKNVEEYIEEGLLFEGPGAVTEALKQMLPIHRVFIRKGEVKSRNSSIAAKAKEAGIIVAPVPKEELDRMSASGHHQGIIAICAAHEYAELEDIFAPQETQKEEPFVIVLDGVTDPHNLGAIIRTAEAAGAHGLIIPKRRAVGITPTVVRASAGAVSHLPVARVTNLVSTIKELKSKGLWICGADVGGESLYSAPVTGPIAVVIGGEDGLSRLVRESCDFTVSIPMRGKIGSLNASVAAAVVLYEIRRRRDIM